MTDFENRVANVTGTTGSGRAIAKRLATGGCKVVACGLDAAANTELQKQVDTSKLTLTIESCDVSDPKQVQSAVANTVAKHGRLDIIVNAAAIHPFGTAVETDPETWNHCMMVNVGSIFLLAHFGIPEIKKSGGGAIVNVASDAGRVGTSGETVYAAAKGGVIAFTRSLAREMAARDVRVNCVCPGPTETEVLSENRRDPAHAGRIDRMIRLIPLRRVAQPEEIADAVAFFCSDTSRYITGQILSVSGGLTMV